MTSNPCIPVKNTLDWNAVAFCAFDIMQLFSVVFCVITAVHKFDFRLVINETPDKWKPEIVTKLRPALSNTHVFDRIHLYFPPFLPVVRCVKGIYPPPPPPCRSNIHSKWQDISYVSYLCCWFLSPNKVTSHDNSISTVPRQWTAGKWMLNSWQDKTYLSKAVQIYRRAHPTSHPVSDVFPPKVNLEADHSAPSTCSKSVHIQ
jgi:hypothetical protein